ncbi:hypothetical protein [Corynebacterium urealyticum]|uniref:hypothetical protein n=1 Tax=Corynebacterium urealyticum TaxID=43771 RepID=UPI0011E76A84|nr:hypothetical protein [Corynebacterium urealyticum]TYR15616.1 hypothetical protein FYJ89_03565 [Corynebacterium urealyticum]TYR17952.1 hypothetical protein FYJ88_03765 [Corynebacterium urealyticum]
MTDSRVVSWVRVEQRVEPSGELTFAVFMSEDLGYVEGVGLLEAGKLAFHNDCTVDPFLFPD